MTVIIELTGKMGSGKTTIASKLSDYLVSNGFTVLRIAFASPIKKYIISRWGILKSGETTSIQVLELDIFNDLDKYARHINPKENIRKALQEIGTEIGRENIGENVWVDSLIKQLREHYIDVVDFILIDDYRFPNENLSQYMNECKIYKFKIHADIEKRAKRLGYVPTEDHASEAKIDSLEVDATFTNNEKEDLDKIVNEITKIIL